MHLLEYLEMVMKQKSGRERNRENEKARERGYQTAQEKGYKTARQVRICKIHEKMALLPWFYRTNKKEM